MNRLFYGLLRVGIGRLPVLTVYNKIDCLVLQVGQFKRLPFQVSPSLPMNLVILIV